MSSASIKNFLLYCGVDRENYFPIRPLLWRRNIKLLRITTLLSGGMGLMFLILNLLTHSGVWLPYLVLVCGSLIFLILAFLKQIEGATGWLWSMFLCYGQMILVCIYAGILSTQPSNYDIPATSVIVFIALFPLSIDDRPIRMFLVMLTESAVYLCVSSFMKSPHAFSLDVINTLTFCLLGMILYSVICTRNVREIYQSDRVERIQKSVISSLATVVEERDENTGGHIGRTGNYVEMLIGKMKKHPRYSNLPDEYCNYVTLAAPMHDIGKIRIPDAILNKPGRLTEEEFEIMKKHAVYGADIIRKTLSNVQDKEYSTIAVNIAHSHHERYDGTGYPDGLKGEQIPLEARIMALADVYDALVSERVYKKAFPPEKARRIISEESGKQFDPLLAELFLEALQE